MRAPFSDPAKAFAADFVARNERAFITLNDSIFYFGELGVQETRSAGLMTAILERHGFRVERGISGFATSFMATYGQGAPVIAIHTEYDANPSNSQKSGVAERAEIVPDAPGLRPETSPLDGPAVHIAASNDCGDVSWKVPMGRLWFPGNVPHLPFHHWTAGAALATSIAHKGGVAGAKALAASVIDFLENNDLVAQTKDSFKRELGGVAYKPLLPADQRAPADLNRALMDKFRPQMEAHYVKADPQFTV